MRQASWIAFLLLTVGLLTYEASVSQQEVAATGDTSLQVAPTTTDEGSWPEPPTTDEGSWPPPKGRE